MAVETSRNSNPDHLQRYRILEKLGEGGMGAVYRAADRLTGQTVALKRVTASGDQLQFASQSTDQDFRLSLAQEFRTLAGLRHPHIVSVLDYGFDAVRQPYFTMQLIENARTLTEYAASLDIAGKVRVLGEMLQALAYLHRRGIIHRDLKPANVLVTADGVVKVMDFGLALQQTESITDLYTGAVGTLAYMAPEMFADQPATVQSDLYAVGTIAYEVFVGKHPFNTKNLALLVNGILNERPNMLALPANFPDLETVLEKLLAKTPPERYSDADEVITALFTAVGQPVPAENAALRESYLQAAKFVGRDTELGQLITALDSAARGQGSAWLIGGESGVGKSRLLEEVRVRALVEGMLVLRGQAVEGGGLPYQLWRDPLRRLVLSTELSDLEAGVLREVVSDINLLVGRVVPEIPALEGQAGQQRLVRTLTDVFRRQTQPVMLLLEDLQWTEESLVPLKRLNELVSGLPLLIIGTYRNDEAPALPATLPGMYPVRLARLTDDEIAELSESMLGKAGKQAALVELLRHETEGNTYFMVEVVRTLAENAGRLADLAFMTLPQQVFAGGVQQIVRQRINRVPSALHPMLRLAAVFGRQPELTLMEHLYPDTLNHFLLTCSGAAVLEMIESRWRFTHDKLRETILHDLEAEERKRLYRLAAETIEQVHPDDSAYAEVLLENWFIADDLERTLHYTVVVCEQLINRSEFFRARQILSRETGMLDQTLPEASIKNRAPSQARLLTIAGNIAERQGDYPEAADSYHRALQLAPDDSSIQIRSLLGLASLAVFDGDYSRARPFIDQAMRFAVHFDRERAQCISLLGMVAYNLGNHTEALQYYEQALAIDRELNDQIGIVRHLNSLGLVVQQLLDYTTAIRYFEESLAIAKTLGDRSGIAYALGNLATTMAFLKDYATAFEYSLQSLELKRETGDQSGIAISLNNLGDLALRTLDLEKAARSLAESLHLTRQIQFMALTIELLVNFATLRLRQGDPHTAAHWLGLALHHPAIISETLEGNAKSLRQELETLFTAEPHPESLAALLEQGRSLDLDLVVRQILEEYGAPSL